MYWSYLSSWKQAENVWPAQNHSRGVGAGFGPRLSDLKVSSFQWIIDEQLTFIRSERSCEGYLECMTKKEPSMLNHMDIKKKKKCSLRPDDWPNLFKYDPMLERIGLTALDSRTLHLRTKCIVCVMMGSSVFFKPFWGAVGVLGL